MIFRQLFDAESSTYTYLIADETSREAVLIDPVLEGTQGYLLLIDQLKLKLLMTLETHTHADHVTASSRLREATECRSLMGKEALAPCASGTFSDGDHINIGALVINVIHTPGHTDDSYSFHLTHDSRSYLFTGDTLLIRGTGRTDFQNGDAHQQYHSLFERLLSFPDDTLVYPGHDYKGWTVSTIGEEKQFNPRLQTNNAQEYATLMANLHLPTPKLMDIAVPANQACGAITSNKH